MIVKYLYNQKGGFGFSEKLTNNELLLPPDNFLFGVITKSANGINIDNDEYYQLKQLGRGSEGEVYLYKNNNLNRYIVEKVYTGVGISGGFEREKELINTLRNSENILEIGRIFEETKSIFFEPAIGSLNNFRQILSQDTKKQITRQILKQIIYLLNIGLFYTDIKLDNILVFYRNENIGLVKLGDLGSISRENDTHFTSYRYLLNNNMKAYDYINYGFIFTIHALFDIGFNYNNIDVDNTITYLNSIFENNIFATPNANQNNYLSELYSNLILQVPESNEPINENEVLQPYLLPTTQTTSQPVSQPVSQSTSQPVSQSTSQSVSQPVSQSMLQPQTQAQLTELTQSLQSIVATINAETALNLIPSIKNTTEVLKTATQLLLNPVSEAQINDLKTSITQINSEIKNSLSNIQTSAQPIEQITVESIKNTTNALIETSKTLASILSQPQLSMQSQPQSQASMQSQPQPQASMQSQPQASMLSQLQSQPQLSMRLESLKSALDNTSYELNTFESINNNLPTATNTLNNITQDVSQVARNSTQISSQPQMTTRLPTLPKTVYTPSFSQYKTRSPPASLTIYIFEEEEERNPSIFDGFNDLVNKLVDVFNIWK